MIPHLKSGSNPFLALDFLRMLPFRERMLILLNFVQNANLANRSSAKLDGYSYSLCAKIIETLRDRNEKFQIHTLHVLQHNTRWDPDGTALPIFSGFVVSFNFMKSFLFSLLLVSDFEILSLVFVEA